MAGMISVPVYPTAGAATIEYILVQSKARAIFVGKLDATDAAERAIEDHVLRIAMPYPTIESQSDWLTWLKDYSPLQLLSEPALNDTMTVVYTSGSTGLPKGVVLSYKNIAVSAASSATQLNVQPNDRCMSYLPLAHITERAIVEWTSVYGGDEIYFTESLETFIEDVKTAQPTLFLSVPRLWVKFQAEILAKIPRAKLQQLLRIPLIKSLVARKIRKGLGLNACRLFGSGTAPISPGVLDWYYQLGIKICEGWGMTETSGLSCVTVPYEHELLGTIGRPVEGIEINLSEEGEILIRGEALFNEYYRNSEDTIKAFTAGWFHTGDLAEPGPDGSYKIIGRVKEQFKTAKGKYVSPATIENLLGRNSDIDQACVFGSGRKQPIVIVVLSEQLDTDDEASRLKIHQGLLTTLAEINSELESHERLDHLIVSEESWTIENELLTPTLKIRRTELEKRYQHFVDAELNEVVVWQQL